jgi:hypothetical protein
MSAMMPYILNRSVADPSYDAQSFLTTLKKKFTNIGAISHGLGFLPGEEERGLERMEAKKRRKRLGKKPKSSTGTNMPSSKNFIRYDVEVGERTN